MPRIPAPAPAQPNPAHYDASTAPVASRTDTRDAAPSVNPTQALPQAADGDSAGLDPRSCLRSSPGFAALRPAVDQEFEEPMVN